MSGNRPYSSGGRHAKADPVNRRGLLKAGLIAGAVVIPGSAIVADKLLRHSDTAKAAEPPAAPEVTTRPAVTPTSRPTPVAPPKPLAGKVIVLDPGHNPNNINHLAEINMLTDAGGFLKACNTVGTETDEGFPEWAFNLDVARRARVILRAAGARVIMTQNGHTPYGPCNDWRAWIANRAHADASIAIHADGGPVDGYGFAALTPELVVNSEANNSAIIKPSNEFADALLTHFAKTTSEPLSTYLGANGIQPRDDLAGLNLSTVPKIFIECANMRNASDALKVTDPHWRDAAAEGIAYSIKAFLLE
ncbi:MAG TPA: N-acetylmuramoyl-L-alanine amidase [Streptosporangiaceae bacterium]|nr:N-acetylmuramoyl-L-alanine amidase [Streptosporangiaceae bacterium]